jgi:hypothetical protein
MGRKIVEVRRFCEMLGAVLDDELSSRGAAIDL